jgi:hypothetical protein
VYAQGTEKSGIRNMIKNKNMQTNLPDPSSAALWFAGPESPPEYAKGGEVWGGVFFLKRSRKDYGMKCDGSVFLMLGCDCFVSVVGAVT